MSTSIYLIYIISICFYIYFNEIYFKELAHTTVKAGKIYRMGQQVGNSGKRRCSSLFFFVEV